MNLTSLASTIPKARLISALAVGCIVLALLLGLSLWGNWHQFRSTAKLVTKLSSELAASEARAAADLNACAAVNTRLDGNLNIVAAELQQCRGEEQKVVEQLAKALSQRDVARRQAEGEAHMRREVIESIVRTYETDCASRPICRALSDELLGNAAHAETP